MRFIYELFVCMLYPRYEDVYAAQEAMRIASWYGTVGSVAESCMVCKGFHVHYGARG